MLYFHSHILIFIIVTVSMQNQSELKYKLWSLDQVICFVKSTLLEQGLVDWARIAKH